MKLRESSDRLRDDDEKVYSNKRHFSTGRPLGYYDMDRYIDFCR